MKAFDYIPLYTYQDYLLWEGDWELIHGYPHAMSPSPVRKHQWIAGQIGYELNKVFEKNLACKDCKVYSELDWIVNDSTVVRPDVMIVCGEFKDDFLKFPPVLIVEILSKNTSMKDKNIKYKLYESQQVKYYILVNPDSQTCEIFEWKSGEYVAADNCTNFSFHADCKVEWDITTFISQLNLQ